LIASLGMSLNMNPSHSGLDTVNKPRLVSHTVGDSPVRSLSTSHLSRFRHHRKRDAARTDLCPKKDSLSGS